VIAPMVCTCAGPEALAYDARRMTDGQATLLRFRYRAAVPLKRFFHERLQVAAPGPEHLTVVIEELPTDKRDDVFLRNEVECLTEGEWEISPALARTLEAIAEGHLPTELMDRQFPKIETGSWLTLDGQDVPFETLPNAYLTVTGAISRELSSAMQRTVTLLAWRFQLNIGSRAITAAFGNEWSRGGQTWHPLSLPGAVSAWVERIPQLGARHATEIERLIATTATEPFAYELLREARSLGENTRSAHIMAVTALEIGVKRFLAERIPDATWILDELQTPPVVRILQEFLPTLLPDSGWHPLSEGILKRLRSAVARRNKLAHVGQDPPSSIDVREVIELVAEVLYLLDWYRGFDWAGDHLNSETQKSLGFSA